MKLIAPDYYPQFRCIADRCVHSCCIGWEIDIDPESRERYRAMGGAFGHRLNAAIADTPDGSSFRLGEGERCPMLNKSGLCDLITEKGEEALCQICADHPRYRNFFTDRTEIGLGLCCEAAARLILGRTGKTRLILLEDDGGGEALPEAEQLLLAARGAYIGLMQARSEPLAARLQMLLEVAETDAPVIPSAELYRGLNRLDPAWDDALDLLGGSWDILPHLETALEQFGVYLLYRHLPASFDLCDEDERVRFCVLSVRMLAALCFAHAERYGACTLADCVEYARMYSAEIEYDDENVDVLLDALAE